MPQPDQALYNSEEIIHILTGLVETYGNDELSRLIIEYADKLNRVSQLHQKLPEMETREQGGEVVGTVQDIIQATQDYYTHVASIPQDIRRFLMMTADLHDINDVAIDKISSILGTNAIVMDAPPLSARAIRPENYIMQIDAITNQLATLGENNAIQIGRKGGRPVTTAVALDVPEHMRIEGGYALNSYDKSILNGVTSLIESGNSVFSIPMLYHSMTGRQNPTVDDQLHDELSGKLEKMRRMMITIDLSEENESRHFIRQDGEQLTIENVALEGYLLPLNRVSGTINGKKTELYQILQHPPLYSYSKMKKHLASVDISLLNSPVNNNTTTIPLKTYLLQRVEMMKNRKNAINSATILYESVYRELNAEDSGKTKKMRIRSYTETILKYFIEEKYIKGYLTYKKGRSVAGVKIVL